MSNVVVIEGQGPDGAPRPFQWTDGKMPVSGDADVALGAKDDASVAYGDATVIAALKGLGVAVGGVSVVPSDSVDLTYVARSLYVGGAGDVKVTAINGDVIVFPGVVGGSVLPVAVRRVWAAGTTATNIVGLK